MIKRRKRLVEGFYTENFTNVTQEIKSGKTQFFKNQLEAYKYAREHKSYYYQVFNKDKLTMGYAVPK